MRFGQEVGIGGRIAVYRRLHRLTQKGLADKAHISYSLLTKVESGAKPASPALIAACARALSVPVTELNGQPFSQEHAADQLDGPLSDLRAALDNYDIPLDDLPVRSVKRIAADVETLGEARRAANWQRVTAQAPALIDELVQVSQTATGHEAEQAHFQLMQVYRATHHVAHGLGLVDLASLLLTRMEFSAQRSGSPYMVALYRYTRAYSSFTTGRHEVGRKIIAAARSDIDSGVRANDLAALCAGGSLHLRGAMLASRQGDAATARAELAEASVLAGRLDSEVIAGVNARDTIQSFGPTNVAIHAAAVEMELGNHGKAITLAKRVHPPAGYPAERMGHHWIDTARAQLWTGETDAALASLLKARQISPQQTKYHPAVRETVASLIHTARSAPDKLIGYANWCGVQL